MHPLQALSHLFTESAIAVWPQPLSCPNTAVGYQSSTDSSSVLHSPGFQDTIFHWFSPPLLDPLPVYSPKINRP